MCMFDSENDFRNFSRQVSGLHCLKMVFVETSLSHRLICKLFITEMLPGVTGKGMGN